MQHFNNVKNMFPSPRFARRLFIPIFKGSLNFNTHKRPITAYMDIIITSKIMFKFNALVHSRYK